MVVWDRRNVEIEFIEDGIDGAVGSSFMDSATLFVITSRYTSCLMKVSHMG